MTDAFAVDTSDVATAGVAMTDAASDAGRVDAEAGVNQIPGAIPGTSAGQAASTFATAWGTAFSSWVKGTQQHGEALTNSAEDYGKVEAGVAESIVAIKPPTAQVP